MTKRLLIFPGVGSPYNSECKRGFDLIKSGAYRHGYSKVKIVSWPSQNDGTSFDSEELTFEGACQVARHHLDKWCDCGRFTLFARSFGTLVAARVLRELGVDRIDRVILWGPPPYCEMWNLFKKDFSETQAKLAAKGTRLSNRFFISLEPFEFNFSKISGQVVVVIGSDDQYVSSAYRDYLITLVGSSDRFEFREVTGAKHECDDRDPPKVQKEYLQSIFSE